MSIEELIKILTKIQKDKPDTEVCYYMRDYPFPHDVERVQVNIEPWRGSEVVILS